jgi:ferric-dicitrate binding protein FerR (iron transport regulator)
MINERLAELLTRKLSGEATAAELQELENWLQGNPADQYFSDILLTYWNTHPGNSSIDKESDQHFAHILEMAEGDTENRMPAGLATGYKKMIVVRRVQKLAIAAGLAGIITLLAWLFFHNNSTDKISERVLAQNEPQKSEVVASKGARTEMVLPDGTKVKLNSDSKLQYEATFNDTIREVTLEGEAYFNVVKDPKRPFIVHTSGIDIRVLGTAFNVKSYPLEPTIETTLIHGKVEIINKKESRSPKYLRPLEKIVFNKKENAFVTDKPVQARQWSSITHQGIMIETSKNIPDTTLIETSWVYDKLRLDDESFREAATKMERWYNVEINFKNERVAKLPIHVTFEDESLDEAMRALQLIHQFRYKKIINEVIIY